MDLRLASPFFNSSREIISQMSNIAIDFNKEPYAEEGGIQSFGVASVINFSGKIKGRFLLDITPDLALAIAGNILGEPCTDLKDRMFLAAISEMNNIIAGDANTYLNNSFALGLRLAPPIVISGRSVFLSTPRMSSMSVQSETPYGSIRLNIGFQGGGI